MCIVAWPCPTPVIVPTSVPAPVLQTAEMPNTVDWTVTSASDEVTVPFVPEVQATESFPFLRTFVVWEQLVKERVEIAPPTLAPVKEPSVLPFTSELVHVSVVEPAESTRSAEVPVARVAVIETDVVFGHCRFPRVWSPRRCPPDNRHQSHRRDRGEAEHLQILHIVSPCESHSPAWGVGVGYRESFIADRLASQGLLSTSH